MNLRSEFTLRQVTKEWAKLSDNRVAASAFLNPLRLENYCELSRLMQVGRLSVPQAVDVFQRVARTVEKEPARFVREGKLSAAHTAFIGELSAIVPDYSHAFENQLASLIIRQSKNQDAISLNLRPTLLQLAVSHGALQEEANNVLDAYCEEPPGETFSCRAA